MFSDMIDYDDFVVKDRKSSPINVLYISGSKQEMGYQYGTMMKNKLEASYEILINYYVDENRIPYLKLLGKAELFFEKYPYSYQKFIEGIAVGSNLPIETCKILNAMETLNSLLYEQEEVSACSFIAIPADRTENNAVIVGRNYDFSPPYDEIAKLLTVTVMKGYDEIPTAIISMPGQIYCPSCINKYSIFLGVNNGMPSGGYFIDYTKETLLINLLEILQNSKNKKQLDKQLSALNSDYSLIINAAYPKGFISYEYSSTQGLKCHNPDTNEVFVSTNFYQNEEWNLPPHTDKETWFGVTRHANLINSVEKDDKKYNEFDLMEILDQNIEEGGAKWNLTIYQMVYDSFNNQLYLKIPQLEDAEWINVDLATLFSIEDLLHDEL